MRCAQNAGTDAPHRRWRGAGCRLLLHVGTTGQSVPGADAFGVLAGRGSRRALAHNRRAFRVRCWHRCRVRRHLRLRGFRDNRQKQHRFCHWLYLFGRQGLRGVCPRLDLRRRKLRVRGWHDLRRDRGVRLSRPLLLLRGHLHLLCRNFEGSLLPLPPRVQPSQPWVYRGRLKVRVLGSGSGHPQGSDWRCGRGETHRLADLCGMHRN